MQAYENGDAVRVSVDFKNASGTLTDPTTVTFKFENPAGTETSYVYGVDGQLVKSGTGEYYVDITGNSYGTWLWRFIGTGTVVQVDEGAFFIKKSEFA